MTATKFVACSHCDGPVAKRRPSANGEHYCQALDCRRAKQRAIYRRNRARATPETSITKLHEAFIRDLAHAPRMRCEMCGLENALPGWLHRSGYGSKEPCYGVGSMGRLIPQWLDLIHPELKAPPEPLV